MTDVTINGGFARVWAKNLRERYGAECQPLADVLDPPATALREAMFRLLGERGYQVPPPTMDALLAVVADWLDAQPRVSDYSSQTSVQRDHDVRLIRGETT